MTGLRILAVHVEREFAVLVPVEWLRDYTDFDLSPEDLAERLTMAGLEVEEIREVDGKQVYATYVTPNRSDLLSVTGVARDISALLSTSLRMPEASVVEGDVDVNTLAKVDIETENCGRYSARVIQGVKIVESPKWMQDKLSAAGMRPINNVVDATNYVLLELGQPLHAFDHDLIADHHIIVRQATQDEKIVTIDGEERALTPEMMVIADTKHAVAVAGVMGGFDSEVNWQTKNILLESAHFNPRSIRRTARNIQLSTEASYRFERVVDPNLTIYALDRVAQLIQETGGGAIARGIIDVYPKPVQPAVVEIRPERASAILGFEVTPDQVTDYLTRLGMKVEKTDKITVTIPTFRPDVTREEDLIEEVGRVYGYQDIPETLPRGSSLQGRNSKSGIFAEKVAGLLVSCGLQEIVTGTMVPKLEDVDYIPISNPMSEDLGCLRGDLIPSLLRVIAYNAGRGVRDIGIYEIGRISKRTAGPSGMEERLSVAAAITGSAWGASWNVDKASLEADFYLCKGILENLLTGLGIPDVSFTASEVSGFHPTRTAIVESAGDKLGVVGEIGSEWAETFDLPGRTYVFELDFPKLMERSGRRVGYTALSRYPAVTRDLAVVVGGDTKYRRVAELIAEGAGDLLESLTLFDVYTGKPLLPGHKSMAFSIVFRSRERTLRDEEVDERLTAIRDLLTSELGVSFRD